MSDKNDLRLLYQVLSSQIEFAKRQQWTIAYYTLLFIGGLVGFSELIYKKKLQTCRWDQVILFLLAAAVPPVAMASVQLIWKNEKTMCKNRWRFKKMRSHLSWPFRNSPLPFEGSHLVGKGMDLSLYTSSIYDMIFWLPPLLLTFLASLISYAYLFQRFLMIENSDTFLVVLRVVNTPLAVVLSYIVFFFYQGWDRYLVRRAEKKRPKDTSLHSILRRIGLLVTWICTGHIPPCAHSCLHAFLIKCVCKGHCSTEVNKTSQP